MFSFMHSIDSSLDDLLLPKQLQQEARCPEWTHTWIRGCKRENDMNST